MVKSKKNAVSEPEKETETEEITPVELEAVSEDAKKPAKQTSNKTKKTAKPKKKSVKYLKSAENISRDKTYPIAEAIELVKKTSYSKFDGTVDLAIRIEKSKKGDDAVRGTIKLPHGTGKNRKVEIATDDLIEKIKNGYSDFDILLATPAMMPKLAQAAKILGPKGKMPNPKDGTVVDDPSAAVQDLQRYVAMYRLDIGRNIHISVGKVSWESAKITENINTVLKALMHLKKESATLCATMGPGVKLSLT